MPTITLTKWTLVTALQTKRSQLAGPNLEKWWYGDKCVKSDSHLVAYRGTKQGGACLSLGAPAGAKEALIYREIKVTEGLFKIYP